MTGAATCHERLARSIGELRHAVTSLQSKARSQEVVLTELGHRATKGQGLSGWVDPTDLGSRTRASSPTKDRIRQLESCLASLRTRVELLEEARPAQRATTSAATAEAVAEAAASAAKANEEVAEIKRASAATETSFRDALRSCEADVRQRMDDVQRQIERQARALEAALNCKQEYTIPCHTISHVDRAGNPTCHSARTSSERHGIQLQADNLSLEQRLTELEVGLALQRRSSDDSAMRLRSEVTRSLKLAKVEGARLEGAMEAKLDELDHQMRASAHGHEAAGLMGDRQVLDQAMQAAASRVAGSMQASLRVLGDRQHCLDLQISSVTTGLRACGEEQERLAKESVVRNDRLERRFAELSEACQSSNEAADIRERQHRRLSAVEEQQFKAGEEQQKQLADLEQQFAAKLSSLASQESSQALRSRLEGVDRSLEERFEAMQNKLSKACGLPISREVVQHSKLVEELQQKMKEQAAEMSCFEARCHGEFSEVLHKTGQASEAAAVAGAVAKRGQEAAHRLWDEEAEFREHLAAAVGSLRAEIVDRNAMIEDRMTRSQGRVAQELGEQRARADSRMASLEEQLLSGSLAELLLRDVEELSQTVVKREVQVAKGEWMKASTFEFECISQCLSTLYTKVGLSQKDALASLQKALKPESEEPVSSDRFTPRDRRNDGPVQMSARETSTPRSRKEPQPKLRVRRQEVGPGSCQAASRQTPRQSNIPGPSRLGSPGGPGGSPSLASPRPSSLSGLAPPGPPPLGGRGTVASA